MRIRLVLTLVVAATFLPHAQGEPLVFSAIGCGPYSLKEEPILERYVALVGEDGKSEFLVHLGDIVSGSKKVWPEAQYIKIRDMLAKSKIPVFVVLGDNEWNDLDDPAIGLKHWTRHFLHFDKRFAHGWPVARQEIRPENLAFTRKGVLMIGINLVGGRVHDAAEWATRMQHDVDWVRQCLGTQGKEARAVVVFAQTEPKKEHRPFFEPFAEDVKRYGKPVLYLHADGHVWQHEPGFMKAPNLLRVQTDQLGRNPPVQVTVTDDATAPFVFDRRLPKKEKGP